MSWLLELLVDAIREMCSQFIVDMMELITNMFTELLSCNLSLFEELFSVVGSLYKNVIVPTGIAILLMILVWQLFKSMFGGKAGVNAEEPIELICRSAISLFHCKWRICARHGNVSFISDECCLSLGTYLRKSRKGPYELCRAVP